MIATEATDKAPFEVAIDEVFGIFQWQHQRDDHERDSAHGEVIPFSGSMTVKDAYLADSLIQPLGNKIAAWIMRAMLGAAFGYLCWFAAFSFMHGDYGISRAATAASIVAFVPLAVSAARAWLQRRRAEQLWNAKQGPYAHTQGEVTETSIHSRSESSEGSIHWSAFGGFRATESVAVLFPKSPGPILIMARSKFSHDEDWERFLSLMRNKLQPH